MTDQSVSTFTTHSEIASDQTISLADRIVLRELARRVAELAARPCEQEKRNLWYAHNNLEPTRPVIFCDPENGWHEIIPDATLQCSGLLARSWEMRLRKEIFWGTEMQDDRVIMPTFDISHVYTDGDWGLRPVKIGGQDGGSYRWDPPLKDYARDFERLRFPQITIDQGATQRVLALAQETLGDLLTVRLKTAWWWSLGMTWTLIDLRGMMEMMYDIGLHPTELHRLMAFLRDGHQARLDFLEQNGLLSLNNDGTYVGSGGFGWTHALPQPDFAGRVRLRDLWGFGESQETTLISPAQFEEFVFQYQLPILERFGLNCYGCCEPLEARWHVVMRVPHLRRVSVSPFAHIEKMADFLGDRYIFSWKPSPMDLAGPTFDEELIRRKLREGFRATRACRVEAIMKDNHTIGRDPRRVVRWVAIAREEAEAL